ncbi:hypothetical protein [Thioalkalivibrio sp. ALJ24]|uniref:hypothetical protein n=1 Tax=Thioalkalivibrio sp. ALJ24 TaxID=545276 RepID=UPI00036F3DAA|nr:hypothetical protein [Thioalkalivibrio sp. ALJ24]
MLTLALILAGIAILVWLGRDAARLAHAHRQVVRAWERFDVLLCQRNALILELLDARDPQAPDREDLYQAQQASERARRSGDLQALARAERQLRAERDRSLSDAAEANTPTARLDALDEAITDAIHRYNHWVNRYQQACRRPTSALMARLTACGRYGRIHPDDPKEA